MSTIPAKRSTRALKIAELIMATSTDERHLLLAEVEDELKVHAQYFTARCIKMARIFYESSEGNVSEIKG